jgi:acyl-CoA hydrolase
VVIARAGADSAKLLIAEINKKMPRTHGNTFVHYSHLDYVLETDFEPVQTPSGKPGKVHMEMGKHIASIIPDGACLQAGIGGIPDAALLFLKNHKDLGVHTEMFADGLVDLWKSGAITCRNKKVHPGKITAGFTMGTSKLYNLIADNPLFHFDSATITNDPWVVAQNPKTVAINSALQVDLSGQINAESFGTRQFSGIGGQVDFVRGAALSEGGLPIIALESTASKGKVSRIVPSLYPGAAVTTPRWEGCIIATEYGVAPLWGLNTRQRASALIKIAHPKFREELAKQAAEMYGYE